MEIEVDKSRLGSGKPAGRRLSVGDEIIATTYPQDVTVLACTLVSPSNSDEYALWVILCHRPSNKVHPFAVWNACDRPNGWSFSNGDYCSTIAEAVQWYERRGGKYDL